MITCTAFSGPMSIGKIVAPPHPGTRPRKTSGSPVNAVAERVRYLQCKPTSNPPPSASPLIKANVGIPHSSNLRKTSWPSFPIATAWERSVRNESAERSAPAAKINGLPVMAIAAGLREIASVIAASSAINDCGPNVFGRV